MTNSTLVEGISMIVDKIAKSAIETANQGNIWTFLIFFFALIGFVSVVYAVGNNVFKGFNLVFYSIVVIPGVFIVSMLNKKKRKERLDEWGEIKDNLKGKNKWKFWVYLGLKIGIPLLIVLYAITKVWRMLG